MSQDRVRDSPGSRVGIGLKDTSAEIEQGKENGMEIRIVKGLIFYLKVKRNKSLMFVYWVLKGQKIVELNETAFSLKLIMLTTT